MKIKNILAVIAKKSRYISGNIHRLNIFIEHCPGMDKKSVFTNVTEYRSILPNRRNVYYVDLICSYFPGQDVILMDMVKT